MSHRHKSRKSKTVRNWNIQKLWCTLQIPKEQEVTQFKRITMWEHLSHQWRTNGKLFLFSQSNMYKMRESVNKGEGGALLASMPISVTQINGFELIRLHKKIILNWDKIVPAMWCGLWEKTGTCYPNSVPYHKLLSGNCIRILVLPSSFSSFDAQK